MLDMLALRQFQKLYWVSLTIYFGVIFVISLSVGLITPPFGLYLYSVSMMLGLDIVKLAKSSIPFYILVCLRILLLIFLPQLVLFLPRLM